MNWKDVCQSTMKFNFMQVLKSFNFASNFATLMIIFSYSIKARQGNRPWKQINIFGAVLNNLSVSNSCIRQRYRYLSTMKVNARQWKIVFFHYYCHCLLPTLSCFGEMHAIYATLDETLVTLHEFLTGATKTIPRRISNLHFYVVFSQFDREVNLCGVVHTIL